MKSRKHTPELPPLKLYQNIHKLPLEKYIDCICDNNLYALVISGTPTIEELQATWEEIKQQVSEIGGSDTHSLLRSLYKEVNALRVQYSYIINTIEALRLVQDHIINKSYDVHQSIFVKQKELCNELNTQLKSSFKFNIWDEVAYYRDLSGCVTRSGSIKIKLDLRTMAYEQVRIKAQEGGKETKITRSYFDKVLINISQYAKYELTESITVSKFYERIKRYTEHCKNLSSKK